MATGKMNIVDEINAYESGELSQERVIALFQELIYSGKINHLQGSYQRTADSFLQSGHCHLKKNKKGVSK